MTNENLTPEDDTVACARCDKVLQNVLNGVVNQPSGAAAFTSTGHYGSDFDPMDGSFLEVNICNECLDVLSARKQVLLGRAQRRPEPLYVLWVPESTEEA